MTNPPDKNTPPLASRPKYARGGVFAWIILLGLLGIVGVGLWRAQQGQFGIGEKAPDFTLTTFDGQTISLQDYRGKVVLLNFWASWCIPCEEEADELEAAWQLYKDNPDVIFLGVAWSDMDTKAKGYIQQYDITYPNAPDMGTRASQAYRITGVPETYVIDRNGILAYVKFSPFQSVGEIQAAVERVLQQE